MLSLLRRWRRRRTLAKRTIPDDLWSATIESIPVLVRLDSGAEEKLRELALLFLHEKHIEPAGGLELDESMCLRVAVLALSLIHI